MNFFRKPIFSGFAPNMTLHDVRVACAFLLLPWRWSRLRTGRSVERVEDWFRDYLSVSHAVSFDSGRSALFFALKALGVSDSDEVLVQGYTCVVVSNAIIWTGAKPVYVDVEDSLNMDPADLEKRITAKSKVLVIQHTFGLPAKIAELLAIAKKHHLRVIEDCAHSLGARYKDRLVGTFGDISVFSFGSSKVVSSVRGGIATTRSQKLAKSLGNFQVRLPKIKLIELYRHLIYYPVFLVSRPLYNLVLGKFFLLTVKHLGLLARIVSEEEKMGQKSEQYPSQFPNALAKILLDQLNNLDRVNKHRRLVSGFYAEALSSAQPQQKGRIWLFFPILVRDPKAVAARAKSKGVQLGTDWSYSNIVPAEVNPSVAWYKIGDCPKSEELSRKIIYLPTHRSISKNHVSQIISTVK